uniref:Uncharacterized protein n=1 Tax=Macaca fascicularis TaxID=9541 RepID=A0A7N9CVA1_MACFA
MNDYSITKQHTCSLGHQHFFQTGPTSSYLETFCPQKRVEILCQCLPVSC